MVKNNYHFNTSCEESEDKKNCQGKQNTQGGVQLMYNMYAQPLGTHRHTHPPHYVILTLSNGDLKLINLQNTNLFPMTGSIIQVHALASYYLSCSNGCAQQNVIYPNVTVSYEYLSSLMHLTSHEV